MKKTTLLLLFILSLATLQAQRKENSATHDEGVVINGVRWATRNVDVPGTFTESPESSGMFFQWNRRKAWNVTDRYENWDNSTPEGTKWYAENDPCPAGWRVPTKKELQKLIDAGNARTTESGITGVLFGTAPNQIFIPDVGSRTIFGDIGGRPNFGLYWSSEGGHNHAWSLYFYDSEVSVLGSHRAFGFSVRCVAIVPPTTDSIFEIVHQQPEFPGGGAALLRFFHQNLRIPPIHSESLPTGNAILQFIVRKDGTIDEITVLRGIAPAIDREIVRVMQLMPRWTPGEHYGRVVNTHYTLPIRISFDWERRLTSRTDEGVVINGIRWATRNVDAPGTFTPFPESPGMFFQWNRREALNWENEGVQDMWSVDRPTGTKWYAENAPCPDGWRVPTKEELQQLVDAGSIWTERNGVRGRLFGTAPYQIFLPAAGWWRARNNDVRAVSTNGNYWSSSQECDENAVGFGFGIRHADFGGDWREHGRSVRCVAKN